MNRAVFRLAFPFDPTLASKAVGLFSVIALIVLSVPQAEAQCVPLKRFTSRPNGMTPPALYISLPADGWGMEIGQLWQSDGSSINNFGGGCPPESWLHEGMIPGRVYIDGGIGSVDCVWSACPQDSITLALEDERVDGQDAYLIALQALEGFDRVFDFTCSSPPPHSIDVLPFLPFPGIGVVAAHVAPPNITLTLDLDDAGANVHTCPEPLPPPPSSIIESYDLLVHYGPTDPGRQRSSWIQVLNVPYVDGAVVPVELVLSCPSFEADAFLALGVNFQGGVGGPVSSALVSASIVAIDVDGDGINDCHDTCIDRDGDGYGDPGVGGSCLGLDCDDEADNVYPGAPQVCDGLNNDCDHANWPALNNTNEYDDDGDGLSECEGDCDDTAGGVYPGAPQVCDGLNNDCDHANWPALNNTNEYDDDGDGLSECEGDCDDTAGGVYPGAPQVCDGLNNDCDHANWPALNSTNEYDDDGDGLSECEGDCDDTAGGVYPGAPQVCDGVNNDCSHGSWPGLGNTNEFDDDTDELSECEGDCDDTDQNNWVSCATCSDVDEDDLHINCDAYVTIDGPDNCPEDYNPAQTDDDLDDFGLPCDCDDADPQTHPGAVEVNDGLDNQCLGDGGYGQIDETSGNSGFHDPEDTTVYSWPPQEGATQYEVVRATRSDFGADCMLVTPAEDEVEWIDEQIPEPGEVYYYANRPIEPHVGSWGADATGEQRHLSCISYVWSFVDTNEDDVSSTSLYEFFDATPAGPSDYIRVWVLNAGWCAERADFYRESYLQLAPVGGTVSSGNWSKWRRPADEGWIGPDLASHPNQFGNACWNLRAYCWGSEVGLFEGLILYLNPDDATFCEAEFFETGCFSTLTPVEVRIAGTFDDACNAPIPTLPPE